MEDDMTRSIVAALMLMTTLAAPRPAAAGTAEEVRAAYQRFVTAQNARDLAAVREVLADTPQFLWVSDGQSIWGREATLSRMASFQEAEIWRVEPGLQQSVTVPVSDDAGFLHLPLDLVIGAAGGPDRLKFLVSVLCVKTGQGWRIAALFTTTAKQP
jgi:ketosteroid isomerase-like protein